MSRHCAKHLTFIITSFKLYNHPERYVTEINNLSKLTITDQREGSNLMMSKIDIKLYIPKDSIKSHSNSTLIYRVFSKTFPSQTWSSCMQNKGCRTCFD